MEKTRSNYVLFSFNERTQSHQEYIERKRRLETILETAGKKASAAGLEDHMLSARIEMDSQKQLLVCLYKKHSFAAVMDNKKQEIHFHDNDNRFVNMKMVNFDRLELRLENAINYMINTGTQSLVNKDVNRTWEPAVPILEKLIAYENALEKLPEANRKAFQQGKAYDQRINEIIYSQESKEMHPLEEQAWEDYLGIDIGHAGMRNMDRPMSSLEEDIMEKNYHKDFGNDGFVDEPWNQREHVEPIQNSSLKERLDEAKQEAIKYGNRNSDQPDKLLQNEERELSREW